MLGSGANGALRVPMAVYGGRKPPRATRCDWCAIGKDILYNSDKTGSGRDIGPEHEKQLYTWRASLKAILVALDTKMSVVLEAAVEHLSEPVGWF